MLEAVCKGSPLKAPGAHTLPFVGCCFWQLLLFRHINKLGSGTEDNNWRGRHHVLTDGWHREVAKAGIMRVTLCKNIGGNWSAESFVTMASPVAILAGLLTLY